MIYARTLEEIQQATDYNQAEHEDILRLYAAFFNRPPDAAGARYWTSTSMKGSEPTSTRSRQSSLSAKSSRTPTDQ